MRAWPPSTPVKRAEPLPSTQGPERCSYLTRQRGLWHFRWPIFVKESDLHNREHRHEQRDWGLWGKVSHKPSFKTQAGIPLPHSTFSPLALSETETACPESALASRGWGKTAPSSSCAGWLLLAGSGRSAPAALPAAAGSLRSWRRRLLRLPWLLSSSSPALTVRLRWPRSSVLCPGTIATLFAPWGRSTSQGNRPSAAGEESAGHFPHGNKLLKLAGTEGKPQSGLWTTLLLFQKALPFAVTQAVAILGSLLQARGGPSVGSIAFAF